MTDHPGIESGRLSFDQYADNFSDVHPPLDRKSAVIEASRCHYCFDAPCIEACPTGINIPSFIRKIATDNVQGSAVDILSENIMGGACARVCPTEILCEEACVRTAQENKPVQIGALQRYAVDGLVAMGGQPFTRAPDSGKTVAVVGGGPAGMACAHRLALFGHKVVVLEAREKAGGLNEYGIAAYKVPDSFAQKELDFILSLGGIEVRNSQMLGRDYSLGDLRRDYDAVFLGIGQAGVNALNLEGETLDGVINAVDFIRDLRQAEDLSKLPVGRKVVVIGGGNTAIDAAVQARRLGAEDVILVYRRGAENMSATHHEQDFAQLNGVKVKHWVMPVALHGHQGRVKEIELEYTQLDEGGRLIGTGDRFRLYVDMVFKAIGQTFLANPLRQGAADMVELDQGRIAVNDERKSSLRDVWAGGDCVLGGQDLTVAAVQDGKVAAESINRYLQA